MKPVISFYIVLVLFQSLIFGNMVSIELPANNTYAFQETFIHNSSYLDPFLVPENAGLNQNLLNKNDFTPLHYHNKYLSGNSSQLLFATGNSYSPAEKQIPSTPIIVLLGVLRI
jgi:hypothetical protein